MQPNGFTAPGSADFIKPQEYIGHLVIVRPLMHVMDVPGLRRDDGSAQDGILVDGVILTAAGPDGQPKAFRGQTWIHARLVGSLKGSLGTLVLARIGQGTPKPGSRNNSIPLELQDATNDPQAVAAAQAWVTAHPGYFDTPLPTAPPAVAPAPAPVQQGPSTAQYQFGGQVPGPYPGPVAGQPVQPAPIGYAQPAPVQPVQPALPLAPAAPVAPLMPAAQPLPAAVAAPGAVSGGAVIQAAVWDALGPDGQARMTAQGYTRGA